MKKQEILIRDNLKKKLVKKFWPLASIESNILLASGGSWITSFIGPISDLLRYEFAKEIAAVNQIWKKNIGAGQIWLQ